MASRFVSFARTSRLQSVLRAAALPLRNAQKISVAAAQPVRCMSESAAAGAELVEILDKELVEEQRSTNAPPALPKGWTMKEQTDNQFTLETSAGKTTVSVEVDINNLEDVSNDGFDDPDAGESEAQEGEGPQYLPNFTITLKNASAPKNIRFFCSFEEGPERDMVFTVNEMCLFEPGSEKAVEERKVYHCNTSVLDADMYEGILKYLQSTGVDPTFLEFLIGMTQSYEQGKYVNFLKGAIEAFRA